MRCARSVLTHDRSIVFIQELTEPGKSYPSEHLPPAALAPANGRPIMSLILSVKLNGHDPFIYLKDILSHLPIQPKSRTSELLWLALGCLVHDSSLPSSSQNSRACSMKSLR